MKAHVSNFLNDSFIKDAVVQNTVIMFVGTDN